MPISKFENPISAMSRIRSRDLAEAERLLREVQSWTNEEIEELPELYKRKARQYRQLPQSGEG